MEGQEMLMKDVKYVHVEDTPMWRGIVEEDLKANLGTENKLGDAASLASAVSLIEELARQGVKIDLIILDQSFPVADGGSEDTNSSREFVKRFKLLTETEDNKKSLEKTVIVMLSATADQGFIAEMQTISGRVIGLISKKNMEDLFLELKKILEDKGIVKKD